MNPDEVARDIHFTPVSDFADPKPGFNELGTLANIAKQYSITAREMRSLAEKYLGLEERDFDELQAELDAETEAEETNGFSGMTIPEVVPVKEDEENADGEDESEK
jgi:hypothetical protein